jgi:peptidoglycan hydrolase CwlO-like protein
MPEGADRRHRRIGPLRFRKPAAAKIGLVTALVVLWLSSFPAVLAENGTAETAEEAPLQLDLQARRELLQKGLDLHEIDRELARMAEEEIAVAERIAAIEADLERLTELTALKKKEAGRVLRSYYIGRRETLYLQLLKMDNLVEALAALDFIQMIFRYDRSILDGYRDSVLALQQSQQTLRETQEALAALKQAYLAKREEQMKLAEELEQELAVIPAAAEVRSEIELLTMAWEMEGLPLFRQYFANLSETMRQLPELIAEDQNHLTVRGSQFVFQLTDEDLNRFLRSKNAIFENLTFRFEDGIIVAEGRDRGHHVSLSGSYTVVTEPENSIRFHVHGVTFDGFNLPETTARALEEEFDLGIYPVNYGLNLEATDIVIEENTLKIMLKSTTNWLESIFGGWLF